MIGVRLHDRESGAEYVVTAATGGAWVIARTDAHETPFAVSVAEIADRFDVEAHDPTPVDEARGWEALAAANAQGAGRLLRRDFDPPAPTPEDVFAAVATNAKGHG